MGRGERERWEERGRKETVCFHYLFERKEAKREIKDKKRKC